MFSLPVPVHAQRAAELPRCSLPMRCNRPASCSHMQGTNKSYSVFEVERRLLMGEADAFEVKRRATESTRLKQSSRGGGTSSASEGLSASIAAAGVAASQHDGYDASLETGNGVDRFGGAGGEQSGYGESQALQHADSANYSAISQHWPPPLPPQGSIISAATLEAQRSLERNGSLLIGERESLGFGTPSPQHTVMARVIAKQSSRRIAESAAADAAAAVAAAAAHNAEARHAADPTGSAARELQARQDAIVAVVQARREQAAMRESEAARNIPRVPAPAAPRRLEPMDTL